MTRVEPAWHRSQTPQTTPTASNSQIDQPAVRNVKVEFLYRIAFPTSCPTLALATMFRTAVLRSARCLAQAAPRTQVPVARSLVQSSFQSRVVAPAYAVPSIRSYSAPAGLSQDEVQGRILDLLKNFDKVRWEIPISLHAMDATEDWAHANATYRSPTLQRYILDAELSYSITGILIRYSSPPLHTSPTI